MLYNQLYNLDINKLLIKYIDNIEINDKIINIYNDLRHKQNNKKIALLFLNKSCKINITENIDIKVKTIYNNFHISIGSYITLIMFCILQSSKNIYNIEDYITKTKNLNISEKIKEYVLTNQEKNIIKGILEKAITPNGYSTKIDKFIFYKCLYIYIYKLNYTTGQLTNIFNRNIRTIEMWLKRIGWDIGRYEAQKRAAKNRNYKHIRNKGRQTLLEKYGGSNPEDYTRQQLNVLLPQLLNNTEIVVGLNNISILNNGKEIDIPILIFYNNQLYKFDIKYNGFYWHKNKIRDKKKEILIQEKGYIVFQISPINTTTNNQLKKYINTQITLIIMDIKKTINYAS